MCDHKTEMKMIQTLLIISLHLSSDSVLVSVDDPVEVPAPHSHTVHVTRRNVTQDVHLDNQSEISIVECQPIKCK